MPEEESENSQVRRAVLARDSEAGPRDEALLGGYIVRLRILAWISMGSFAAASMLAGLMPLLAGRDDFSGGILLALCMAMTGASAFLLLAGERLVRSEFMALHTGLAFVVLTAGVMAAAEVAVALRAGDENVRHGLSGLCIWIVLFPLLLPCSPRQAIPTAFFCALTLPTAYLGGRICGLPHHDLVALADWFLPPFFCAAISSAASTSVWMYLRQLAQARREIRSLGRYRLEKRLAGGGMGEVWLARHGMLPRPAAVKVVGPGRSDPLRAERFTREAAAISLLECPHTVHLYDHGTDEQGSLWYAMELLDGVDLQTLVEQFGPQPPGRVVHLLAQACLSLAEAHGKGLVHRDVKPANLMACRLAGICDFVKVLDFGLVDLIGEVHAAPVEEGSGLGSTVAGTPGYIAPELMTSDGIGDPRSDLYGLGCTAYWLLTGSTVFPHQDGVEEMRRHLSDMPVPPSHLEPNVPGDLEELVLQLLAKRPSFRPQDARSVRQRLLSCACATAWDETQAARWWDAFVPGEAPRPG